MLGLFAFVNGVIAIGLMAAVALVTGAPFIFPSLGPTAFLLFYTPMLPTASPAQLLVGHAHRRRRGLPRARRLRAPA